VPKLFLLPNFKGEDRGDGGIRRVVEAQRKWLPTMGWDLVEDQTQADVVATHAGVLVDVPATTPMVSHCHGLYWYGWEWERWALKLNRDVIKVMRRADVVTAPSKWVAYAIARGTNIDAPVLYHGVDPEDWEPSESPGNYVLWNKTRVDPICDPRPM
jgi:glycosyltransferase involved in cell wall biosynthesis